MDPTAELAAAEASSNLAEWWAKQLLRTDPANKTLSGPGDTVRLSAKMLSGVTLDPTSTAVAPNWFVMDPEIVTIDGRKAARRSVLVRGLKPGRGRVLAVYQGHVAVSRLLVGEADGGEEPAEGEDPAGEDPPGEDPPDPGEDPAEGEDPSAGDPVGVATTVSGAQPNLLAGDTITIRPKLLGSDSAVISTETTEWSLDFDPAVLSVSNDFLVTALAPTPTGSATTLVLRHIETGLAVDVEIVILSDSDPGKDPGGWPDNEPVGMTPILNVDGSSKYWPGFSQTSEWANDSRVTVVNDAAAKYGKAVEKRFFIGDPSGWHGLTQRAHAGFRQLYFRLVFKFSPNWQYHTGMNKFFYWGSTGRRIGTSATQFYLGTRGGAIEFVDQSASGEADSKGTFRANAPRVAVNAYHTVEVLHVSNTPGRSDGSLRMWINGVEVESFNHLGRKDRSNVQLESLRWLDYNDTKLTGLEALLFWGGQGDTKRVNDWVRLSELYVSGRN